MKENNLVCECKEATLVTISRITEKDTFTLLK